MAERGSNDVPKGVFEKKATEEDAERFADQELLEIQNPSSLSDDDHSFFLAGGDPLNRA